MAREKHIFENSQICHMWAHQSADWARNKQDNLRFNGAVLRSYATDIAQIYTNKQGAQLVLLSENNYSVTTSGQLSDARRAVSHLPYMYVSKPAMSHALTRDSYYLKGAQADHRTNVQDLVNLAAANYHKSLKARANKAGYISSAVSLLNDARQYAAFFRLPKRITSIIPADPEGAGQAIERAQAKHQKELKARADKQAADQAKYRQFLQSALPAWYSGANVARDMWQGREVEIEAHNFKRLLSCGDLLRVINDGLTVETSGGAEFPMSHALRALGFSLAVIDSGAEFKRNGRTLRIGHFQADSISRAHEGSSADAQGQYVVRAGCHEVHQAELTRFYGSLTAEQREQVDSYKARFAPLLSQSPDDTIPAPDEQAAQAV